MPHNEGQVCREAAPCRVGRDGTRTYPLPRPPKGNHRPNRANPTADDGNHPPLPRVPGAANAAGISVRRPPPERRNASTSLNLR